MILCVCHNISESQVEEYLSQGYTLSETMAKFQVGSSCGACISFAYNNYQKSGRTNVIKSDKSSTNRTTKNPHKAS